MGLDTNDRDWNHLYPEFRDTLKKIVDQVTLETAKMGVLKWALIEGYRSTERQLYLYGQGRLGVSGVKYARAGDQVTWDKVPRHHGYGLAADLAPMKNGQIWWEASQQVWSQLRHVAHVHGCITGMDWKGKASGDTGHVQFAEEKDAALKSSASLWLHSIGLTTPLSG